MKTRMTELLGIKYPKKGEIRPMEEDYEFTG